MLKYITLAILAMAFIGCHPHGLLSWHHKHKAKPTPVVVAPPVVVPDTCPVCCKPYKPVKPVKGSNRIKHCKGKHKAPKAKG